MNQARKAKELATVDQWNDEEWQQLFEVILHTGSTPMEKLGKWFTINIGEWTAFDYVFKKGDKEKLIIESEAQLGGVIGRGKTAVKEYGQ